MSRFSLNPFVFLLTGVFRLWQMTFSAIMPPSCRFTPSCSAYGIEALQRHGAIKGCLLTLRRLMRCHPITFLGGNHGHDPVPPHK
jgi:uncharacterized protein